MIEEEDNIALLSNLDKLEALNLEENPINKNDKYKELINIHLPNLKRLDSNK